MKDFARGRIFLSIERAAEYAGFCVRHFRRVIKEDGIPVQAFPISQSQNQDFKFFILGRDLNEWANRAPRIRKPLPPRPRIGVN